MILTIIYFFLIFSGFGLLLIKLFNLKFNNTIEKIFISIGFGLGAFVVIVSILHLIHFPFDYRLFSPLILGIIFMKDIKKIKYNKCDLIAVILFLLMFLLMFYGSTKYPYLEDSDPWGHALSSKYISIEKNAWTPKGFYFHYIDPYPPSYDIMMGILHQTNDSIKTTLKFFNSLLIGLSIIFFYYFAKRFTKNDNVGILSTFVLFCLPCFMSHFIWSQSLAIPLMIISFYCLTRIEEWWWEIIAGIMIASVLLTQPSTAVIFIIMILIFCIIKLIFNTKKFLYSKFLFAGLISIFLSGIYWFTMFFKYGFKGTLEGIGLHATTLTTGDTSGGVIYKLTDFIIAPISTKIDQPIGLGIFIFILLILYLFLLIIYFKKIIKIDSIVIALCWLIFTFLGVMGNALPFKLFPHRFWVYFSISVAIMVGEFLYSLFSTIKNRNYYIGYIVIVIILIGILLTSFFPKLTVNTSMWPSGPHVYPNEIEGLYNLDTLPYNTKVFNYFYERDLTMVGMDKLSLEWESQVIEFRKTLINSTVDEVYDFLKENDYEYLYISGAAFRNGAYWYGENVTINNLNNLINSVSLYTDKFFTLYTTQGTILIKVI